MDVFLPCVVTSYEPDLSLSHSFFECFIVDSFGDRMCRARKNQWHALTTHQSKREEVGYQFQEYIFALATEENCKIFDGGMIKDRVENLIICQCT